MREYIEGSDLLHDFSEGRRLATLIDSLQEGAKIEHANALRAYAELGEPLELGSRLTDPLGQMLHLEVSAAQHTLELTGIAHHAGMCVGAQVYVEALNEDDFPITEYYHSTGMMGTGKWELKADSPRQNPREITGEIMGVWVAANVMRVRPKRDLRNIPRQMNGTHFDVQMVDEKRQPRVNVMINRQSRQVVVPTKPSIERVAPKRRITVR